MRHPLSRRAVRPARLAPAPLALLVPLLLLAACGAPRGPADVEPPPDARKAWEHYNLDERGVALHGYDPVAYFPEHGGTAVKGLPALSASHRGVIYHFASEDNRAIFLEDPRAYEPQYGGWCAWAMADGEGEKVSIDPESFTVEGGELFLFYDGLFADTRDMWLDAGGAAALDPIGDRNWRRISDEKLRAIDREQQAAAEEQAAGDEADATGDVPDAPRG